MKKMIKKSVREERIERLMAEGYTAEQIEQINIRVEEIIAEVLSSMPKI